MAIDNIADLSSIPRLKSGVEWPEEGEPWWSCTTKCYNLAKESCGEVAQCDFLCDIADLGGGCTISIAAACAIYCIAY